MGKLKFEEAIKQLEDIAKELESRRTWTRRKRSKVWRRNEIIKDMYYNVKWSRKENKLINR